MNKVVPLAILMLLAPLSLGVPAHGQDEPTTRPAAQPAKIAFVLDSSASMRGSFAEARDQILAAIKKMPADHSFLVLIDSDQNAHQFPQFGFSLATADAKKSAERFLNAPNFKPKGESRLRADVLMATKFKPDVIALFTDGDWSEDADNKAAPAMIAAAVAAKVKIDTTLSATGGRTDRMIKLYNLSHATGGVCYDDKHKPVKSTPTAPPPKPIGDGPSIFSED